MKQFQSSDFRFPIRLRSGPALAAAILLVSAVAGAVNVNGAGVSLNLPTADLASGSAQNNGAGARLVSAGTPDAGVVSTNPRGAKVILEPMNAMAGNGAPVADFSADPLTGRAPLEVQFTDLSTSGLYTIDSWSWEFGDASPVSSEQNPKHTYDSPGTYNVTLTVSTTGGLVLKIRNSYISVVEGVPATSHGGLLLLAAALAMLGGAFQARARGGTSELR